MERSLGASFIDGINGLMPLEQTLDQAANYRPALELIRQYREALLNTPASPRTPTPPAEETTRTPGRTVDKSQRQIEWQPLKRRRNAPNSWVPAGRKAVQEILPHKRLVDLSKLDQTKKEQMKGYVSARFEIGDSDDDSEPQEELVKQPEADAPGATTALTGPTTEATTGAAGHESTPRFGSLSGLDSKPQTKPSLPSFGVSSDLEKTQAKPTKPALGNLFGLKSTSPEPKDAKPSLINKTSGSETPKAAFSFGKPETKETNEEPAKTPLFSFGTATPAEETAGVDAEKPFSFTKPEAESKREAQKIETNRPFKRASFKLPEPESKPAPAFEFKPAHSELKESAEPKEPNEPKDSQDPAKPKPKESEGKSLFSFGPSTFGSKEPEKKPSEASTAPKFSFGQPASGDAAAKDTDRAASQPLFGKQDETTPTPAFGKPEERATSQPAFGLSDSKLAFGQPSGQSGQPFGQPFALPAQDSTPNQPFVFGKTNNKEASPAPAAPGFTFGAQNTAFGTNDTAFKFGETKKDNDGFKFGTNPAGTSSASTAFGAPKQDGFKFGTSSASTSSPLGAPAGSGSAFTFGGNDTNGASNGGANGNAAAPNPFGMPPPTNGGANANPFGKPAGPAPAFGNAFGGTSAFGAPASTAFGATAAANPFGAAPAANERSLVPSGESTLKRSGFDDGDSAQKQPFSASTSNTAFGGFQATPQAPQAPGPPALSGGFNAQPSFNFGGAASSGFAFGANSAPGSAPGTPGPQGPPSQGAQANNLFAGGVGPSGRKIAPLRRRKPN